MGVVAVEICGRDQKLRPAAHCRKFQSTYAHQLNLKLY